MDRVKRFALFGMLDRGLGHHSSSWLVKLVFAKCRFALETETILLFVIGILGGRHHFGIFFWSQSVSQSVTIELLDFLRRPSFRRRVFV